MQDWYNSIGTAQRYLIWASPFVLGRIAYMVLKADHSPMRNEVGIAIAVIIGLVIAFLEFGRNTANDGESE